MAALAGWEAEVKRAFETAAMRPFIHVHPVKHGLTDAMGKRQQISKSRDAVDCETI